MTQKTIPQGAARQLAERHMTLLEQLTGKIRHQLTEALIQSPFKHLGDSLENKM